MRMSVEPNEVDESEARSLHCWFAVDKVPGDDQTTRWKRSARLRQAKWREAHGHEIGSHPYGKPESMKVGSRLDLTYARKTGANFLTPAVRRAVEARLASPERLQTLEPNRLWADLLSSMPLCFNLFGELATDGDAARRAVHAWWPEAPKGDVSVLFEHSPGRRDPSFLNNRSAFDVAFEVGTGECDRAIVGVETKYHEHAKVERVPNEKALARYVEVSERAAIFVDGWRQRIVGTALQQIWLDHLLVLAMLQHPSARWSWGRFVLVYPSENPSFATAAARYRDQLRDASTFEARTIGELLGTPGALDPRAAAAIRRRYLG